MIIYIDETGDLGFNFVLKKTTKFFVLTAIIFTNEKQAKRVMHETKRFKSTYTITELKGKSMHLKDKEKLFRYLKKHQWKIISIVVNKRKIRKIGRASSFYDLILSELIKACIHEFSSQSNIELIIDLCKNNEKEIKACNEKILQATRPIHRFPCIAHEDSKKEIGLQLADIFSYGIFKAYEAGDNSWYSVFEKRTRIVKR